jgi:hypothetical protein
MLQEIGAACFGAVVGWATYYLLRYRESRPFSDLATMIGTIGGAAVLALFPRGSDLFAAYGVGLATGFFAYALILLVATLRSGGPSALVEQSKDKNPFMER